MEERPGKKRRRQPEREERGAGPDHPVEGDWDVGGVWAGMRYAK